MPRISPSVTHTNPGAPEQHRPQPAAQVKRSPGANQYLCCLPAVPAHSSIIAHTSRNAIRGGRVARSQGTYRIGGRLAIEVIGPRRRGVLVVHPSRYSISAGWREVDPRRSLMHRHGRFMHIAGGALSLVLAAGCVTEETSQTNSFMLAGDDEVDANGTTTAKSRIRMLEKKVESMPERVDLQMRLARAYHDDKQFEEAIATLTRAVEREPRNSQIHFLLGEYYVEMNRMPEAEASFRRAAQSSREGFTGPSLALGYALAMQEKYAEAIGEFEKVLAIDRAQPTALYYLACCHDSLGARAKAIEYLTRCAEVKSPHQEKAVQELKRLQLLERTGGTAHAGR